MNNHSLDTLLEQCHYHFPHPDDVDPEGNGVIALGGDLLPSTLVYAYAHGLFPWFNDDDAPLAWWSPEPRCVLHPDKFQPSKSLKKHVKKSDWIIKVDSDFKQVIQSCALPRTYDGKTFDATWITDNMQEAYNELHMLGFAHSIEIWNNQGTELYGGLYGLKLGNAFFGESMFYKKTDASKMAFWYLNCLCQLTGVALIDCQLPNNHLMSLGATTMYRDDFLALLPQLVHDNSDNTRDLVCELTAPRWANGTRVSSPDNLSNSLPIDPSINLPVHELPALMEVLSNT